MSKVAVAVIIGASMSAYIGTKLVNAKPMTRGEYNIYRAFGDTSGEDPNDPGYLVEYVDGGKPNDERHKGYISWSPAAVFERSYHRSSGEMTFSDALTMLKLGHRVARSGWNAANQWLSVSNLNTADVPADRFWSPHNREYAEQNGGSAQVPPCITIKNAQGQVQMGWVPSQGDLFANDWVILEEQAAT